MYRRVNKRVAGYVIGVILIASGLAVLYKIFSGSSIGLQIIYYPFVGEKSAESSTNVSASFSCEECGKTIGSGHELIIIH